MMAISWFRNKHRCWVRWWWVDWTMSGLGGELLGNEMTRSLVGYVLVGDWWVSYLRQGKVHLQVFFYDGHTWYENDKLDCIKSLQSVPLCYCLLYIWYASELMTGILGKCGYILISHIIWHPWVCTGLDAIENFLLTRVTKNPVIKNRGICSCSPIVNFLKFTFYHGMVTLVICFHKKMI